MKHPLFKPLSSKIWAFQNSEPARAGWGWGPLIGLPDCKIFCQRFSFFKLSGVFLGLFTLSACSFRLNTNRIEADIKADIERQGRRVKLAAVTCPNSVNKQAEVYFRCVGELPSGEMFSIHVTQQDDQGTVSWDVPSSKALINLINLEGDIEDELGKELGQRFVIDCGDAYRVNRPGDAFECDVVGGVTVGTDQIESILVKVDSEGNLNWQEVRQPGVPVPPSASSAATTAPSATAATAANTSSDASTVDTPSSKTEDETPPDVSSPPPSNAEASSIESSDD